MDKQSGFSLVEVLLSLLLMASTALTLIQQQESLRQSFHHLFCHTQVVNQHNNQLEDSWMWTP